MGRISLMLVFLLLVIGSCCPSGMISVSGNDQIALIEIKGTIIEPDDVIDDLEKARRDNGVKAVVLRVDSPGGSVGASQEIYETVKKLDKIKPVVVSMGDVAASGGYYVAAGARKIFANAGTVTGSIGIRMELVDAAELFEWMKLKPETLKSGEFKDAGSVYRALKPEERKYFEDFLAELHEQFKNDVAVSRGLDINFINEIADGRIYSGAKAKEMGLIDEVGGLLDARGAAAEIAGIKGDPKFYRIRKEKPWWYDFISEKIGAIGSKIFMYEWKPF